MVFVQVGNKISAEWVLWRYVRGCGLQYAETPLGLRCAALGVYWRGP